MVFYQTMALISLILFVLVAVGSLFLLVLGLPGNWILLAGAWAAIGLNPAVDLALSHVLILLGLCLFAELVEWLCGVVGAKRYGVSTAGVWGAVFGGFVGALFGGMLIPVVGSVPGGLLGTFLGAFGVELRRGADVERAWRLGRGAFIARMLALTAKVGVSLTMAGLGFIWLA